MDGLRRLFQNFEQRVGGLLHHAGGGEDEDALGRLGGEVVGALDEGAHLAELDQQLGRVGRNDEHIGVGLDQDAGVFLVGLAQVFAGEDRCGHMLFQIGGRGDADAVGAVAAEAGEGLAVGPQVTGLALALDGHGEHEGEGIFACAGRAGEDERVGQAAGGDGGAQRFDGRGVAEEVVEVGGKGGGRRHDGGVREWLVSLGPIPAGVRSLNGLRSSIKPLSGPQSCIAAPDWNATESA